MPFIHLRTDRSADAPSLRTALAAILESTLAKPPMRCMLQIDTQAPIAMGDGTTGCAFIELRLHGQPAPASINACADALREEIAAQLAIPPARIYLNFLLITGAEVYGTIH